VDRIVGDTEVFINIEAVKIEGKIGFGGDVGGGLVLLDVSRKERKDFALDTKVVYAGHIVYDDLMFLAKKRINGLVCNTVSYGCLKKFLGKDIGVALTGNEDIPFSLIILHGFSRCVKGHDSTTPNPSNLEGNCYKEFTGKYALLKPYTQIRAGATRPSVYIQDLIP